MRRVHNRGYRKLQGCHHGSYDQTEREKIERAEIPQNLTIACELSGALWEKGGELATTSFSRPATRGPRRACSQTKSNNGARFKFGKFITGYETCFSKNSSLQNK